MCFHEEVMDWMGWKLSPPALLSGYDERPLFGSFSRLRCLFYVAAQWQRRTLPLISFPITAVYLSPLLNPLSFLLVVSRSNVSLERNPIFRGTGIGTLKSHTETRSFCFPNFNLKGPWSTFFPFHVFPAYSKVYFSLSCSKKRRISSSSLLWIRFKSSFWRNWRRRLMELLVWTMMISVLLAVTWRRGQDVALRHMR